MNKITFPLASSSQGPEVKDLQEALVVILKRGAIQTSDEVERQVFIDGVEGERVTGKYGEVTSLVVKRFQQQHHLNAHGKVDEATANSINTLLTEWGLLGEPASERLSVVVGQVQQADGAPLKGGLVRAFHKSEEMSIRLGEDTTDAQGRYTIRYDLLPGLASIDLSVSVLGEDETPLLSSEIRRDAAAMEIINLNLADIEEPPRRVFGTVRDEQGELLTGVKVQAFDRTLRDEKLLGEAQVQEGHYEIRYQKSQLHSSDKESADLVLKVRREESELYVTSVHHHALPNLQLDITIKGAPYQGQSEWESLNSLFRSQLHDLDPSELRENDQFQDFSFLAGQTGRDRFTAATWSLSFRLAQRIPVENTAIDPAVLFAFLSQGQPSVPTENLIADMEDPARRLLLEETILSSLGGIAPSQRRTLLETAIANNLLPPRFRSKIDKTLEDLHKVHLHYAAQKPFGGKGTIAQLLELTPEVRAQQNVFMEAFVTHEGRLRDFWPKLVAEFPEATVKQVQLRFELGTLTRNHIPLVAHLAGQIEGGAHKSKRDLAKLSIEEWIDIFDKTAPNGQTIGVPENIEGENPTDRKKRYAAILERQFERTYPTASLTGKLSRNEIGSLSSTGDVARFLENNPDLHLDRVRLDHYLTEAGNENAMQGIEDEGAVLADLKSVQRVFKLDPSFKTVNALLSSNIDSSQQIYFMGESQFLEVLADSEVNKIDAKRVYRKAENAYAYALAMFGDYNLTLNGPSPDAVTSMVPSNKELEQINSLPSLRTLFGSLDYCECIHCRSVYSPAAYFVDVMRFLGFRRTHGKGINAGKILPDVLLGRRPDLGEIELSCENTNTPVPYIDLVNEILEDMVAPTQPVKLRGEIEPHLTEGEINESVLDELKDKKVPITAGAQVLAPDIRDQWAIRDVEHAYKIAKSGAELHLFPTRQTFLSAAELRANPEYTNKAAYEKLRKEEEVFPMNLPFDLWQIQVRTYLEHLGVPQPRLQTLFQRPEVGVTPPEPTDLQIDCAWLGITWNELKAFTGGVLANEPWKFWGLQDTNNNLPNPEDPANAGENIKGNWIEVLGHVNVMLNRTGLTYKELLQLLDLDCINADGSLGISKIGDSNAANCDTANLRIVNLDDDKLNRIHRFIRLWRKVGCAMWELDLLLPDVNPGTGIDKQITVEALQAISRMRRLKEKLGVDWRTIRSFYEDIDHKVYLDRNRAGFPPIQTLYQRLFHNPLLDTDSDAGFPATPAEIGGTIAAKIPAILAALRIKQNDLDLILSAVGRPVNDPLDIGVLNTLHRFTVLAQSLNLNIDQFLRLKRLCEDPFASPLDTQRFVELAQQIAVSRFSVLELDYLLQNQFRLDSGIALETEKIVAAVTSIREGLQQINDEMRLKSEETEEAYVKSKLGRLPALEKLKDQHIALGIIDNTFSGNDPERENFIATLFKNVLDPTEAKTKLAKLSDPLTPEERQAKIIERFKYVQAALKNFLVKTGSEDLIQQIVAEMLQLEVTSAGLLLSELLVVFDPPTVLFQTLSDSRLIEKKPDGTYAHPIDIATFEKIFQSFRLLHKNAMVIRKLNMKAVEVRWWLNNTHTDQMGWMKPNSFPTGATSPTPVVDINLWLATQQFYDWKNELPQSDVTALEFASDLMDPIGSVPDKTADEIISELAKLTGWTKSDLETLRDAFNWKDEQHSANIRAALRQSSNLLRLTECIRVLQRLGVSAERALTWSKAEPGSDEAESLKQTVKAKYDLKQWQQIIQPIQDNFREQKRQALVAWLIAHPNQTNRQNWTDANDLYGYFLIDVEMSPCMLTSRIKQAAASAQLFVQRCLLNLEDDIRASTDLDSKWKQWKWMKQYRVWEANRKVFLYPENWIEPELRDQKSPFFKDLEDELIQNDITNEIAEQAYLTYLEKLDQVANLEIRTLTNERTIWNEPVLHVFGRTRSSQAPQYYYRKRINLGRWTSWERVGIDINANHLMAGIYNRRLHLIWPQILTKAIQPKSTPYPQPGPGDVNLPEPEKYWDIRLFWSELTNGKWTPKVLSDRSVPTLYQETGGEHPNNIAFSAKFRGVDVPISIVASPNPTDTAPLSSDFYLTKLGKQITPWQISVLEVLKAPTEGRYWNNLIIFSSTALYFGHYSYHHAIGSGVPKIPPRDDGQSHMVLSKIRSLTHMAVELKGGPLDPLSSVFVWDSEHVYLVDYRRWTETTYTPGSGSGSGGGGTHSTQLKSSFQFFIHYHPFVDLFIKELNFRGIKGLLNRTIQTHPTDPTKIPGASPAFKFDDYLPTLLVEKTHKLQDGTLSYPVEEVDFSYRGAYSSYNWELFFHVPFFIANKLSANQRFEEALEWFHYIFNPTSTDTTLADPKTPQQRYWITKPFYETTKDDYRLQKIENIMLAIAKGDLELRKQVEEWRNNPFNPHLIARMRTVAYQKNVVIKYIQTLIAWGDQLFRRDTIETINEATQLYILAASVLGPRPKSIPRREIHPPRTFYKLQKEGLDDFGNAVKEVENLLPNVSSGSTPGEETAELPRLDVLYFGIPNNEKLLTLWDTVADRLFKVRHCMNIEGVVRQLPLFEPPIDPALLVRATAMGLDIATVISDLSAPLPFYRFNFMIQRALDLCNDVKALGNAMLSAVEKRDAEAFQLLRSRHEQVMLDRIRLLKEQQVHEALHNWEALNETRKVAEERQLYYDDLIEDGLSGWETASLALSGAAVTAEIVASVLNLVGAGTSLIPEVNAGASGVGGTPHLTVQVGGRSVTTSLTTAAEVSKSLANILQMGAGMATTVGSFQRRKQEWEFQKRLADKEIPQIDKQIAAADLRHQIAEKDLDNQHRLIENAQKEDEYLRGKFTNQELYDWMLNQISTVYFQSYQLAYDIAKRAEHSFRYELGLSDSSYIQFGYWDSLRKGLLSGERLHYDLKRMEASYYEQNRREFELTKHISLAQLDPVALLKVKQNGECFLDIPETVFDMDYPGHYFRRLKTVALSIPCIAGPYTTIACTLTLTSNQLRKDSTLRDGNYARDLDIEDPRFRDEVGAIQSIATSNAQNDHGMFELNFRDERYLPFEGAGAISSWQIKLNKDFPQFDYATISDVIIHLTYTAREGGELMRSKAASEFNKKLNELALKDRKGLYRVFDLKREYSAQWARFLRPSNPDEEQALVLENLGDRLPFFTRKFKTKTLVDFEVAAKMKDQDGYLLSIVPFSTTERLLEFDNTYQGLHRATSDPGTPPNGPLSTATIKIKHKDTQDFKSLPADAIQELFLIINYTIT